MQRFTYTLGKVQTASTVLAETREPNHPAGWVGAATFTDALGRVVQQKAASVVGGQLGVTSASTLYDDRGQVRRRYIPVFASPGSLTTLDATPGGAGHSTYAYDGARRLIQTTNPDGTASQVDPSVAWETSVMDACWLAAGCTGGKKTESRDAHGRVVEVKVYEEGTATPKAKTNDVFDGLGRLRESMQYDNPSTKIQTTYDSLGRKIQTIDPDSGTWKYGYDHLGNLRYQDDPKTDVSVLLWAATGRVASTADLLRHRSVARYSVWALTRAIRNNGA